MSRKPYPQYKPSGCAWFHRIPQHWRSLCLKRVLSSIESGKRTDDGESTSNNGAFSVGGEHVHWNGSLDLSNPRFISDESYQSLKRGRIKKNDTLMVKDGATIGKAAFIQELPYGHMAVNEHVFILRPSNELLPEFLFFLIASNAIQQQISLFTKGAAQPGLSSEFAGRISAAVPPLDEQQAIVEFLRYETRRLDSLAARKARQIALLGEKRDAEIWGAIAQGTDSGVSTAESDIEWLDRIPSHWETCRARFLFRQSSLPPRDEDEIVTAFRDGQVTLRANRRTDGYTFAIKELGYQSVSAGDLVIHSMDAFAGAIGVSESDGKCTGEYVVCKPIMRGIDNYYYAECLRFMARQNYIYVICPAVRERAPRFRFNRFKDVVLPVPPADEQASISRLISAERTRMEMLAGKIDNSIKLIGEYRASLISAAVTGKIDVRKEVA